MTKEEEPKSYITASIESNLHKAISAEAKRNDQSFSKQVQEYKEKSLAFEEKVSDLNLILRETQDKLLEAIRTAQNAIEENKKLRAEIKKITDVN